MFWQAAAPVSKYRAPPPLEADEHCDEKRLIAVSALIPS